MKIFNDEYTVYKNKYENSLELDIKRNMFSPIDLCLIFTSREIFNISLFTLFNNSLETGMLLESTFTSKVVDNVYHFLENKINLLLLYKYINKKYNKKLSFETLKQRIINDTKSEVKFKKRTFNNVKKELLYDQLKKDLSGNAVAKCTLTCDCEDVHIDFDDLD